MKECNGFKPSISAISPSAELSSINECPLLVMICHYKLVVITAQRVHSCVTLSSILGWF